MTDFKYGQIVSAANLNNVAIDLGNAQFDHFSDSVPYAVDQLNTITGDLVSAGILNILNNCAVTVSANGININTGVAVFGDGAKIRITEPLSLPYSAGELFFYKNPTTKEVTAEVGTLPQDNYIWLATVQNENTFIDRRTFAKAKVTLLTEGNSFLKTLEVDTFEKFQNLPNNSIVFPRTGINSIFIQTEYTTSVENTYPSSFYKLNISDLTFWGITLRLPNNFSYAMTASNVYLKYDSSSSPHNIGCSAQITGDYVQINFNINSNAPSGNFEPTTIKFYVYGGI